MQGVGYRYFAARAARELGIRGWVRNLADGRVEALASGPSEAVEAFLQRVREGPSHGRVANVEVLETEEPVGGRFEIRT